MGIQKNWYYALRDEERKNDYFGLTEKQIGICLVLLENSKLNIKILFPFQNNWRTQGEKIIEKLKGKIYKA